MAALSRSLIDRRVLAALELVDAATQERVKAPMAVSSESLGFVRNRSGLHVVNHLQPRTAEEQILAQHLSAFEEAPGGLSTGQFSFKVTIRDPASRYLPRVLTIDLPRGDAAGTALKVEMFAAPTAPVGHNWSGIRARLRKQSPEGSLPLAGARLSLLRDSDDSVLGRGISDERGEVLAIAVGIPIIDFTATPGASNGGGDGNGGTGGGASSTPAVVGTKKVAARILIESGPGQAWPTDPDAIDESGQTWVPVTGDLPKPELETGRILSDGLSFLLEPQT